MNTLKRSSVVLAVAVLSGLGVVAVTVSGPGSAELAHAISAATAAGAGTAVNTPWDDRNPSNEDWG